MEHFRYCFTAQDNPCPEALSFLISEITGRENERCWRGEQQLKVQKEVGLETETDTGRRWHLEANPRGFSKSRKRKGKGRARGEEENEGEREGKGERAGETTRT